jgi:hypothetical protein
MSLEHSPARNAERFCAEPFVREQEAADFLNISVRTLQRWRTEPPPSGAPPFYKLGKKRVVYRLGDLADWAEKQSRSSTSALKP